MNKKSNQDSSMSQLRPVFERQAELCKALAHPVRLEILEWLGSEELSNGDLCERLELPKANVSQHIQILKDAGLVSVGRVGTSNRLSLTMPQIKDACALVRTLIMAQVERDQHAQSELQGLLLHAPRR